MNSALKFLLKRPTDMQIRAWNILLWIIISWWAFYNLIYLNKSLDESFFWLTIGSFSIFIKYLLVGVWCIPLIMWLWNMCLLKSKYIRFLQTWIWFFLIYMSFKVQESANLDFDSLLLIIWIVAIVFWVSGKAITKTCLRYWEKVQKIRV